MKSESSKKQASNRATMARKVPTDFNAGDATCMLCGMRISKPGTKPNLCHFCEAEEFESPHI